MIKQVFSIGLVLLAYSGYGQSIERSVISSAGEVINSSALTLEYSVGEPYAGELSNSTVNVTTGFNQGYAIDNSSVANVSSILEVLIFPNPSQNVLNISAETPCETRIFSLLGEEIYRSSGPAQMHQIDVSGLTKGNVYG